MKTIYVHFNKQGSVKGFPWTVHMSGQCIPARQVILRVPVETVWKPDKKSNPRAFLKARGILRYEDGVVIVSAPD